MVEDSDSHDEDESIEKQESGSTPPPAPPGFEMPPPPPPAGFEPPPPPAGFPSSDLLGLEESQPSEQPNTIDHEAARRMLLGLEDEEKIWEDYAKNGGLWGYPDILMKREFEKAIVELTFISIH